MSFDTSVPEELKQTQIWFASIITQPIDDQSKISPIAPSGEPIEKEANRFILPSETLKPFQRIQIYNQQYWWRLLGVMHEIFPLVVRLFGYRDFNETLAVPYLLKYPPKHWSLNALGDRFPQWVQEEYKSDDKDFVFDAASIDLAYETSFTAAKKKGLDSVLREKSCIEELLSVPLKLQPHVKLFSMRYQLLAFREIFVKKEPEHWEDNPFPPLEKERQYDMIVYRSKENTIQWKEIEKTEYFLLELFLTGCTLEQALERLMQNIHVNQREMKKKLPLWIQKWVVAGIFSYE